MAHISRQQRRPGPAEIQTLLNLFNSGRLPQAEAAAKAMLQSYPGTFVALNVLGVSLEGQGRYAEAAAAYREALTVEPGIAEIHFNLGVVLAHLGSLDGNA